MKKTKKIQRLTGWEWTTLVAAWRYYEHRSSIVSVSFPADIVERFWGSGRYADEDLTQIARQFAKIDHGADGERAWTEDETAHDCDRTAWCKFYAFCNAWLDGFSTVVLDGTDAEGRHHHDKPKCFYCEHTGKWYAAKEYVKEPYLTRWCAPEFIREVRAPKREEAAK